MVSLRPAPRVRAYRPHFEVLEARHLLSTYVVDRLTDSGAGSGLAGDLRYCIAQAADGDAITFGVTGTINLNLGVALPDLAHNISIEGPGADLLTVSGPGPLSYSNGFRVFKVLEGATVSISGLTITNGWAPTDTRLPDANLGGGIANFGTLTLSNSTVTGNTVNSCVVPFFGCFDPTPPTAGGGIFNGNADGTAVLTIINSTVSDNYATANGDGSSGGGIANGDAPEDYGRYPLGGTVILSNSTVSGNYVRSRGEGGGIFASGGGMVMVTNSTVSGNFADDEGGGIFNDGPAMLTIANSTIAGNTAGAGGGIDTYPDAAMRNTILAGNTDREGLPFDLWGNLTSSGYNLIGNTYGGSGFDPTDLLNVDPRLGPLQDNGGPTQTMALLSGSPALNAGDPAQLGVADQRGVIRSGGVNIGAYQASATAFVLSAPDTVDPGTPFDLTLTAVDPFGQPAYGYTGTVTFASTDPDPGVVLPADYTFTPDDQGTHTFSGGVTLVTPGDQTITATDTSDATITGSATVTVTGGGDAPGRQRGADRIDALFAALAAEGSRRGPPSGSLAFGAGWTTTN
jgi:hypothetical protein